MLDKYTDVLDIIARIRPLLENKQDFPEDLEISKGFYEKVHEIGYYNIKNCENIQTLSRKALTNLEDLKEEFELDEYRVIKRTCEKTIEIQEKEVEQILDLLIGIDDSFKKYRGLINKYKLPDEEYKSRGINPNILDLDVI